MSPTLPVSDLPDWGALPPGAAEAWPSHVAAVLAAVEDALDRASKAGTSFDGAVLYAGAPTLFPRDDQSPPFRPDPHAFRLSPVPGPHHTTVVRPGARPVLVRVVPDDFWVERAPPPEHPYSDTHDVHDVPSATAAAALVRTLLGASATRTAFIGAPAALAERFGVAEEHADPPALLAALDWHRAAKTGYELACLRAAAHRAAYGHAAVAAGADPRVRATERELHVAYLNATGHLGHDLPYPTILGWDTHAAVLHYEGKRQSAPDPGWALLADCGATVLGYHSDITRTHVAPDAPQAFRDLTRALDALQRELVAGVRPGVPYEDLHREATHGIARLLVDAGVFPGADPEACVADGLVWPFFPHGLGHHLGLQVHDVGGKLAAPDGTTRPAPDDAPHLRTTRPLDVDHVVTIEPGIYVIPSLLAPLRTGPHAARVDWALVDALEPAGGLRIEDDVHCGVDAAVDLTRPLVPQPLP